MPPETTGLPVEMIAAFAGGVLIFLVGLFALIRGRRSLPPGTDDEPKALSDEDVRAPQRDLLEDRDVVSSRETVDDSMSLAEVRRLKRARVAAEELQGDEASAAREWRKGTQEAPIEGTPPTVAAPASEPLTTPPKVATPTEPGEEATSTKAEGDRIAEAQPDEAPAETPEPPPEQATLEQGLARTRKGFVARIGDLFSNKKELDDDTVEAIEEILYTADIGAKVSNDLLMAIEERVASMDTAAGEAVVWSVLRDETRKLLRSNPGSFEVDTSTKPFVTLVVGVNGVGKTTSIGKLADRYVRQGMKVMMVAGDTFRAAAVEQLELWSQRVGCGFHRGENEADPSSVIFDGIRRAEEEGYDLVLCDTAGRLHTSAPLVDELSKIARVSGKALAGAPHETVLVLDANTGQNAIQQAKLFDEAVDLSGIVLTKLDGTAKGGVILGISRDLGVPVYFIGIGEGIRDLRNFDPDEFVEVLFG